MNVCILFFYLKKKIHCLSYKICLTKNCPCRYEVIHGHRRYVLCLALMCLYEFIHLILGQWEACLRVHCTPLPRLLFPGCTGARDYDRDWCQWRTGNTTGFIGIYSTVLLIKCITHDCGVRFERTCNCMLTILADKFWLVIACNTFIYTSVTWFLQMLPVSELSMCP